MPEFSAQHVRTAQDDFHRLAGFHAAYYARSDTQHGLGGVGHGEHSLLVGEERAVVGTALVVEHGDLPVELADGTVHVHLVQPHAGVVNEVARAEIVAAVHHDVVVGNEAFGVLRGEPLVPGFHADVGVEGLQAQLGLFGFGESDFRFAVEHLPLEVGLAHGIVVNQSDGAHSGTGQVKGDGRTQSAHSHDEYAGLFQKELSCLAYFVEQNLSVVA